MKNNPISRRKLLEKILQASVSIGTTGLLIACESNYGIQRTTSGFGTTLTFDSKCFEESLRSRKIEYEIVNGNYEIPLDTLTTSNNITQKDLKALAYSCGSRDFYFAPRSDPTKTGAAIGLGIIALALTVIGLGGKGGGSSVNDTINFIVPNGGAGPGAGL